MISFNGVSLFFHQLGDEEEEDDVEDLNEMMGEDMDESQQRDLSYWHITVPRIDSIFERNKKVSEI